MHLIPASSPLRMSARLIVPNEAPPRAAEMAEADATRRVARAFRDEYGTDPHPAWLTRETSWTSDAPNLAGIAVTVEPPASANEAIVCGNRMMLQAAVDTGSYIPVAHSHHLASSNDPHAPVTPAESEAVHIGWDAETGLMVFDIQ